MAIAFDAVGSRNAWSSIGSFGWSHTCTGANQILLVAVYARGGTSGTITGVTYNGVSMTFLGNSVSAGNSPWLFVYYLLNPSSGTNTVTVSTDSGASNYDGESVSYTGVSPTQFDSWTATNGSSTSVNAATTVVAPNCWLVGLASGLNGNNGFQVMGGSLTNRVLNSQASGIPALTLRIDDSNGTVSTGSQSENFTSGAAVNVAAIMLSLAPFIPSGGGTLTMMGV